MTPDAPAAEPPVPPEAERPLGGVGERLRELRGRLRWVPSSLRTRILLSFIAMLAAASLASVLVTSEVLRLRLDQRIDAELNQEASELRRLAVGNDPNTGEPFGDDVRRIFGVFLERNVPAANEALITFVDGRPFRRSEIVAPFRLDTDPRLVALWGSVPQPARGQVSTPAGPVEYLAVPLRAGDRVAGVFVAAIFKERVREDVDEVVRAAALVGLSVLLFGSLLAWRLAGRVVGPVTDLTVSARTISESDLSRRITVQGDDEVGQLASTFNEMLERLERSFAAQRRLIDDAGHELRTPLTIVRGHLELLDDDPAERARTLALVDDELGRMARLVDDLLLLAKREQPGFLSLETVDVSALTDELHAKVAALADRDWVLEGSGRGVIVADRQRLTQAVLQLADNAVRHGPPDRPIALGSSVAPDGEARFWVRDLGPGIPEAEREHIFERFRRGSGLARADGSGLGLAIVRAIAEAHGGRVEVSGDGGGTVFTLVVPVDPPQAAPEAHL